MLHVAGLVSVLAEHDVHFALIFYSFLQRVPAASMRAQGKNSDFLPGILDLCKVTQHTHTQ